MRALFRRFGHYIAIATIVGLTWLSLSPMRLATNLGAANRPQLIVETQVAALQAAPHTATDLKPHCGSWLTAPPVGTALDSSGLFGAGVWICIDVTAYITGDGTCNLALTTPSSTAISFPSHETGARLLSS